MTPEPGHHYVACFDPGTRSPIATLAIATARLRADRAPLRDIVHAQQWLQGGHAAIVAAARACAVYELSVAATNEVAPRAVRELALLHGLTLAHRETTDLDYRELYDSLRLKLELGDVQLPADPFVKTDLLSLFRHLGAQGRAIVHIPIAKGGRHAEFAPTIARAVAMPCPPPNPERRRRSAQERFEEREAKELAAAEVRLERRYTSRTQDARGSWSVAAFRARVGR